MNFSSSSLTISHMCVATERGSRAQPSVYNALAYNLQLLLNLFNEIRLRHIANHGVNRLAILKKDKRGD